MRTRLVICTVIIAAAVSGCATRSDFTAISSKNVNVSNMKLDRAKSKGKTVGEDCQHIVILIPTGGPPTIDEAIDRALEAKNASVLLDAVVDFNSFYIPYIYGQTCWKVEGDAYDTYQ